MYHFTQHVRRIECESSILISNLAPVVLPSLPAASRIDSVHSIQHEIKIEENMLEKVRTKRDKAKRKDTIPMSAAAGPALEGACGGGMGGMGGLGGFFGQRDPTALPR